jgi:hypothetical protein
MPALGATLTKSSFSDVKDLFCPWAGLPIYGFYFPGPLSDPFRESQRFLSPIPWGV